MQHRQLYSGGFIALSYQLFISLLILFSALGYSANSLAQPLHQQLAPVDLQLQRTKANPALIHQQYTWLAHAKRPWKICALLPHLKDAYWISVNYGLVNQAKRLGVHLTIYDAGGYLALAEQKSQMQHCYLSGADAIILGSVSPTGYAHDLDILTHQTPVFATVNALSQQTQQQNNLKGMVGVDWYQMGFQAGHYLAKKHPKGSGLTQIAWLPGPLQRGGTDPTTQGFLAAIADSDIQITQRLWADNGKEEQRDLVYRLLSQSPPDYIVGGAVAIDVAINVLQQPRFKHLKIGLISTYFTHGIYRGLLRGRVLFSPTDQMVLQGRLSLDQTVRYLEQRDPVYRLIPDIIGLDKAALSQETVERSLSPAQFRPIYVQSPPSSAAHN
ncbi:TMAO reductase system periplasmic protein TorT [Vibrio stylophorae]|uniref:TMAO reductase system periplasmic protein TorT n=1 Tax=Vibrio stylophorae TaxID=659351 RepID=UPI001F40FA6D|nr:TMAO reductase system periplasmic protein TorT [Vibrio stylophorae]